MCDDQQSLLLLQQLSTSIAAVACQKHGSFSVQALVDTLHTAAQIYSLVEALRKDIVRLITHPSGHFVVLRMLQRFPYSSTKFIDDAIQANCLQVGTDHHGLRVVKAVVSTRRAPELTRLFKQIARLTMKLVENQYGNYVIQSVLDVAPAGMSFSLFINAILSSLML
jgi:mRNA-binding protein PUF3